MRNRLHLTATLLLIVSTACSQQKDVKRESDKNVGGPCEGCEAVFEFGNRHLNAVDTLPDFINGEKKMEASGIVYRSDGKTPAADVILYIYHTNREGIYPTRDNENGWGRRHGYLRGWIKTDKSGAYKFFTCRPGAYPGRENPEHIHVIVKEPGYSPYYIDDFLFDDDPILTELHRSRQRNEGGNGIIKLTRSANGLLLANRNIILGKNVSGYDQ